MGCLYFLYARLRARADGQAAGVRISALSAEVHNESVAGQSARKARARPILAWAAILAFPFFALYAQLTDLLAVELALLAIPFSAALGHFYGRKGVIVVSIGGLFLVPHLSFENYSGFGGRFDIWLISLLVCVVASSSRPMGQWLPGTPMSSARLAIFLLLPVTLGVWGTSFGEVELDLTLGLYYVALGFLFVAGVSGVGAWRAIPLLGVVLVLSLVLRKLGLPLTAEDLLHAERADLPLLGMTELRDIFVAYQFRSMTEVLTGLVYFLAGRVCRTPLLSGIQSRPFLAPALVGLVALLASGLVTLEYAIDPVNKAIEFIADVVAPAPPASVSETAPGSGTGAAPLGEVTVTGSRYRYVPRGIPVTGVFPLLGIVSAFLLAWRGVLGALLVLIACLTLRSLIDGHFPILRIPVSELVVMLGFAGLGIALRNRVFGTDQSWWSTSWAAYLGVVITLALSFGVPFFSVYLPTILGLAVAAGLGAQRFRNWLRGRSVKPNPGWAALLVLITLLTTIWSHLALLGGALLQLAGAATVGPMLTDFEDRRVIGFLSLVALWIALTALRVLVAKLPACIEDLRRAWQVAKALITRQPVPGEPEGPTATGKPRRWWHPARVLGVLQTVTMWAGIAIAVASVVRPTLDEAGEFLEDLQESKVAAASESRAPNPHIMEAAREVLEPWGIESEERGNYRTRIETGWLAKNDGPQVRSRATVYIGEDLDEDSLRVFVDLQTRRSFLWVKTREDGSKERQAADALAQRILERAHALERGP